ncbi:hypothetical protein M0R45_002153 [Rubus argutus]|uniref:Integrase catalytic domain-containing protein n=1 Tax=Rubus argutus TaxID=59490 RepID=A0AAW1VH62_RUBAR
MRTPWPFHTWGLDFIGKINPPSDGHVWIITATEFFTKWVEAIPMRKATGATVSNFIKEYIICRHGIPYKIVTDNATSFVNQEVTKMLKAYGIKHRKSTPYYPQGNEAVSPVEIAVPTARVLAINDVEWDVRSCSDWRWMDLEAADE